MISLIRTLTPLLLINNATFITQLMSFNFKLGATICFTSDGSVSGFEDIALSGTYSLLVSRDQFSTNCEGYLVVGTDSLLSLVSLKPHIRILLLVESIEKGTYAELSETGQLEAWNLIVVEVNKTIRIKAILSDQDINIRNPEVQPPSWTPEIWKKFNRKVRVSLFDCPPFVVGNSSENLHGVEFNILKFVTKDWDLEFSIHNEELFDQYVYIISKLTNKTTDISLCSLWQRYVWGENLTSTHYDASVCLVFLVPTPKLLPDFTFIYQPFGLFLWLACFALLFLTTGFLYFFEVILGNAKTRTSIVSFFFYTVRYFTGSGPKYLAPNRAIQYLMSFWSIFCLLISVYYSAGFTISFQFPQFSFHIDNIEDMIKHKVLWTFRGDVIYQLFRDSSEPTYNRLAELFTKFEEDEELNAKIADKKCAKMTRLLTGDFLMDTEELDSNSRKNMRLITDRKCMELMYTGIAFQYNSPLKIFFDRTVYKFIEHGFVQHWMQHSASTPDTRYMKKFFAPTTNEMLQSFDMKKLEGAYFLLFIGHTLGLVVFIGEVFWWTQFKKKIFH